MPVESLPVKYLLRWHDFPSDSPMVKTCKLPFLGSSSQALKSCTPTPHVEQPSKNWIAARGASDFHEVGKILLCSHNQKQQQHMTACEQGLIEFDLYPQQTC